MSSVASSSGEDNHDNRNSEEDLDAFLTTVESKLRGPFSSLEFAKAVQTHAVRGGTVVQYLQNLSTVLARMDNVIQSRVLIGLLGLDYTSSGNTTTSATSSDHNGTNYKIANYNVTQEIHHIVQQAQMSPTHQQWARVVAGLVQGIIFVDQPPHAQSSSSKHEQQKLERAQQQQQQQQEFNDRPCRGTEATEHLSTLCQDVCSSVLYNASRLAGPTKNGTHHHCPDMNSSFVPYYYSLLSTSLVQSLIPESTPDFSTNPHFNVMKQASILKIDHQLETQRAKEELEHQGIRILSSKTSKQSDNDNGTYQGDAMTTSAILPPGFRPAKLVTTNPSSTSTKITGGTSISSKSTNMFMPKKSNPVLAHRQGLLLLQQKQQQQQKTLLRRKGPAQSLVSNTKMTSTSVGATSSTTSTTVPTAKAASSATANGAASRFRAKVGAMGFSSSSAPSSSSSLSLRNSKMKMIDLSDVVAKAPSEDVSTYSTTANTAVSSSSIRMSKKRRIMEAAAAAKKAKLEQQQRSSLEAINNDITKDSTVATPPHSATIPAAAAAPPVQEPFLASNGQQHGDDEWKTLLQERSNKLSKDDRERIQQFFQQKFNPTPDQTVVKMKLHEQRTTDPITGQDIKETFYLELDYNSFTHKQLRKVKRY